MNMINNNEQEKEIFYSPYGYIEINKTDYSLSSSLVPFTRKNFFNGTINKSHLSKSITIHLKTFCGTRTKFPITVQINETLSNLIFKVLPLEPQFNIARQFRLMVTSQCLRELNIYKTYIDENIKNNALIILLPPEKITFNPLSKTNHIYLDSKNKIATKMDTDDLEYCLLSPGFQYGKRYIEFTLESEPIEKNILIGVSTKRYGYMFDKSKNFYGFILSDCQFVFNVNEQMEKVDYGTQTKFGDKIGILIDLSKNDRQIKYYINNISQGIAYRNIPDEMVYPCVALGFQGTKISVKSKIDFPPN